MKLKIEADEKYPIFDLSEPTGKEMFPWEAVELSDKEWQDYQVVSDAYDRWQERLYSIESERVQPDPGHQPKAPPQYLGNGRIMDGRTPRDLSSDEMLDWMDEVVPGHPYLGTPVGGAEAEIEEASTPRKRDIVDRMAAKREEGEKYDDGA